MSFRTVFILVIAGFLVLCAGLIVDSGFLRTGHGAPTVAQPTAREQGVIPLQQTTEVQNPPGAAAAPAQPPAAAPAPAQPPAQMVPAAGLSAEGGPHETATIGSVEKASGFKYQLELDSTGAAIRTATFSEFDTRSDGQHEPLVFLLPVETDGRTVLSLANRELTILNLRQRLSLDRLSWRSLGARELPEGGQSAAFEATILGPGDQPLLRLTKTYRIDPNTYLLDSTLNIENLSAEPQEVQFAMNGAVGLERERGYRMDMRKIVAGFRNPEGQILTVRRDVRALAKAETREKRTLAAPTTQAHFVWAAAVDRYFAAILVPTPADGHEYPEWISSAWGMFFNPDQDRKSNSGDENIGLAVASEPVTLNPAGQAGSARTDQFRFYIGPKEKSLFDRNPLYRQLGFVQTIDFGACCCPASIINPLAFAILAVMKWMYFVIPNYGVVIIILVLVMRLVMHPVTRHSQVAMHKMSKLAPRAEEIKKKYANNKAEMNKKLMELYREQGASPITGMLPMFLQMPIWIALWSAIYTSIDLRGAPFLPVWITDLSVPDALVSFPAVSIPILGWTIHSLNLLPILMGVAFYLQQKLMPMQQPAAAANPQMAQQQKIMNVMMPLLFPVMLYNAPSGVNLYIMTSTFAGVIEQYVIRKHIQEKEAQEAKGVIPATSKTGGKSKKKKPKPFYRF